jgi:hypothetical protein
MSMTIRRDKNRAKIPSTEKHVKAKSNSMLSSIHVNRQNSGGFTLAKLNQTNALPKLKSNIMASSNQTETSPSFKIEKDPSTHGLGSRYKYNPSHQDS